VNEFPISEFLCPIGHRFRENMRVHVYFQHGAKLLIFTNLGA
jgi:hypothetical protein